MALMPGQKECIETFGVPLAVAAGAGSGKTFTLTRRIAHAFECGVVDDIDQVLAITYTNKAASELKGRIKGALREIGRSDQALKVDGAWISTIHGMCSRILKEHALELGIDPSFKQPSEDLYRRLCSKAIDDALLAARSESYEEAAALFEAYDVRTVRRIVERILQEMLANAKGSYGFVMPPALADPFQLAREAHALLERLHDAASAQKQSGTRDKWLAAAEDALREYGAYCEGGGEGRSPLELLAAIPDVSKAFGSKDYKAFAAMAHERLLELMASARADAARPHLATFISIASSAREILDSQMRVRGLLSTNDLITRCARAFEEHPDIAARYTERFKLVMVDEFQDTNQTQVDMVSSVSGVFGERLCVVGDAQQSIYRFQGADVDVYRRHVARVSETDGKVIKLFDNFRSHGDILSFVDSVFEQGEAFGADFESLVPGRAEEKVARPYLGRAPRITIDFINGRARTPGASLGDVCALQARAIAERFARLKADGHQAGDMVVLLGTMRNSQVYADALRAVGLPAVIVGGSILKDLPETAAITMLARALANPNDGEALLHALSSEVFCMPAADLVALSRKPAPYQGKRSIWDGIRATLADSETTLCSRAGIYACEVFIAAERRVGTERLSKILGDVLVDSGYLTRCEKLGDVGRSKAANSLKLIRMLESIEDADPIGAREAARRLEVESSYASEAPGTLAATGGDFVRIMTMHSSKGLQFPIVAVSELGKRRDDSDLLMVTDVGGAKFLSLDIQRLSGTGAFESKLFKASRESAFDSVMENLDASGLARAVAQRENPGLSLRAALELESRASQEETKRLYYVALTRAMEALVISVRGSVTQSTPDGSYPGVGDLVRSSVFGSEGAVPRGEGVYKLSSGARPTVAQVRRLDLPDDDGCVAFAPQTQATPDTFVPAHHSARRPRRLIHTERSKRLFSYSSLAAAHVDQEPLWAHFGFGEPASISSRVSNGREVAGDDRATDVGSAFHLLAQYVAETKSERGICMPENDRIRRVASSFNLSEHGAQRLRDALGRWVRSDMASSMGDAELFCEVPFAIALPNSLTIEGDIDLLGIAPDGRLRVIDYKTGGDDGEGAEELKRKHALQASCYALATMRQFSMPVAIDFVRVERDWGDGQPQCVHYDFDVSDIRWLERYLADACDEAARCGAGIELPVTEIDTWRVG